MTAWIIGIDKENPQHWEYAKRHRFWDMTVYRPFEVDDVLYFWQAGGSLLGSVRVTQATHEIALGTPMPWNLEDVKRDQYRYRVRFDVIHTNSVHAPRWSELTTATGVKGATNFGPRKVPTAGEAWLSGEVSGGEEISAPARLLVQQMEGLAKEPGASESVLEHDLRTWVEATIVIRRGQTQFRRKLIEAYGGQCAITGTAIEGLLEAAHISPYRGDHTDRVSNGLLLRSDIHTLFDLHLLTVLPDLTVRVAPAALAEPYAAYDRAAITGTKRRTDRPTRDVLGKHNQGCAWLSTNAESRVRSSE